MRKMSTCSILLTVALLLAVVIPAYANKQAEERAVAASTAWLKLVDDGRYDASWDNASTLFKKAVDKGQWKKQVSAVRGPMGTVKSRKVTLCNEFAGCTRRRICCYPVRDIIRK
jgi:hypothetical protein